MKNQTPAPVVSQADTIALWRAAQGLYMEYEDNGKMKNGVIEGIHSELINGQLTLRFRIGHEWFLGEALSPVDFEPWPDA